MTNELYEVALSEDGTVYGPFETFVPGDVRILDKFVKFRVTVFGDFAEDDYRLRGFGGIVDDATTTSGGFGVSPFGRFPFGDGGICLEDTGGDLDGHLALAGALDLVFFPNVNISLSGSASLTGDLSVSVTPQESGSLAMSGALTPVLLTGSGVWVVASFSASGDTVNNTSAAFFGMGAVFDTASSDGPVQYQVPESGATFTTLALSLIAAPGVGKSATITLRKNGADTGLAVTISGTNTTGIGIGAVSLTQDDLINFAATFSGITNIGIKSLAIGYTTTIS